MRENEGVPRKDWMYPLLLFCSSHRQMRKSLSHCGTNSHDDITHKERKKKENKKRKRKKKGKIKIKNNIEKKFQKRKIFINFTKK